MPAPVQSRTRLSEEELLRRILIINGHLREDPLLESKLALVVELTARVRAHPGEPCLLVKHPVGAASPDAKPELSICKLQGPDMIVANGWVNFPGGLTCYWNWDILRACDYPACSQGFMLRRDLLLLQPTPQGPPTFEVFIGFEEVDLWKEGHPAFQEQLAGLLRLAQLPPPGFR